MKLKEKLQDISNKNSPDNILYKEFLEKIEDFLTDSAMSGKHEWKVPDYFNKIIKNIKQWVDDNGFSLKSSTEGHAQYTVYFISWEL
jgi:hypothetical protein